MNNTGTPSAELIAVGIDKLDKHYGGFAALQQINQDIRDDESFTLLGPSGCGKTSFLRMNAGSKRLTSASCPSLVKK